MNWFDVSLVILVGASAFWGMRIGLIGAGFSSVGIVFGWLVAGQLSDNIGGWFDSSLSNDTWVTVIAYVILIIVKILTDNNYRLNILLYYCINSLHLNYFLFLGLFY